MTDLELLEQLHTQVKNTFPEIQVAPIQPTDLIFEERVLQSCFYCGRYGVNWRCPPKLPPVDYRKMMTEYQNGALVYVTLPYTDENFKDVRAESSVYLHKALLEMERMLWDRDYSLALSFTGGSCKLCKNGCGKDRCNNPYLSRSPVEATGANIIESAKKCGIQIGFPLQGKITRIGLLLW